MEFFYYTLSLTSAAPHIRTAILSLSPVWLTSWSTKEHIWENHSFLNKMFAWEWLYIPQSWNGAELVNPGTLCDGGVVRAQHSPPRGRLLFFPVMSILLGISASLHTTCCAQQCGEARASGVVVSACQSQSQGSVSSHQSENLYPDVTCLPSLHLPHPGSGISCRSLINEISLMKTTCKMINSYIMVTLKAHDLLSIHASSKNVLLSLSWLFLCRKIEPANTKFASWVIFICIFHHLLMVNILLAPFFHIKITINDNISLLRLISGNH